VLFVSTRPRVAFGLSEFDLGARALIGERAQKRARPEALSVARGKIISASHKRGQPARITVHELNHTTRPPWEADAEHRSDVRLSGRPKDGLLHTLGRLQRFHEDESVSHVGKRHLCTVPEALRKPGPDTHPLAILVVEETGTTRTAGSAELFNHGGHDDL